MSEERLNWKSRPVFEIPLGEKTSIGKGPGKKADNCLPKSATDRMDRLVSALASATKTISKINRWGLDSFEPREDYPNYRVRNRFILIDELRIVADAASAVEADLAQGWSEISVETFRDLASSLAMLRDEKGVGAVLDFMRGQGVTDPGELLSPDRFKAAMAALDNLLTEGAEPPVAKVMDSSTAAAPAPSWGRPVDRVFEPLIEDLTPEALSLRIMGNSFKAAEALVHVAAAHGVDLTQVWRATGTNGLTTLKTFKPHTISTFCSRVRTVLKAKLRDPQGS